MAFCPVVLAFLCLGVGLWFSPQTNAESERTRLPGLRHHRYIGVASRFLVERAGVEGVLADYRKDNPSVRDVNITIPEVPCHLGDGSPKGVVAIHYLFDRETFFDEQNRSVETAQHLLYVTTQISIEGGRDFIMVTEITDKQSVTSAVLPNSNITVVAESLDHTWNCSEEMVTFRMNDGSFFQIAFQYDPMCHGSEVAPERVLVEGDATTTRTRVLSARGGFDWGCDGAAANRGYCKELEEYRDSLQAAGGNVCVELANKSFRKCGATMRLVGMSGQFSELMPYMADVAPATGLEAIFYVKDRETGLIFPCMG